MDSWRVLGMVAAVGLLAGGCAQMGGPSSGAGGNSAIRKLDDGIVVSANGELLKLQVCGPNVIRVLHAKDEKFFSHTSLATEPIEFVGTPFTIQTGSHEVTLATAAIKAHVELASGSVTFFDASGKPILAEKDRAIVPATVQGEQTTHIQQRWDAHEDESLYGLGQRQQGMLDIKGYDFDLWQRNTNVVIPFLVSSRGYGILWDNPSFSKFGDTRPFEPIPANALIDQSGMRGGLSSGTVAANAPDQIQNPTKTAELERRPGARGARGTPPTQRWSGQIDPPATGDYQFQSYSNGQIRIWIDGKLVIDHWRQNWLTDYDQVKVHLSAGRPVAIKIESGGDQVTTMKLAWKTPNPSADTSLWSEVGDGIDYYFVYGPKLDQVVAGYRQLTGQASLMPKWAFGLWQSRQRYETSKELTEALDGFRSRKIPLDNMVQDWQYWPRDAWGSHLFDPVRFPDPDKWIADIHAKHARLMISVWGKFYPGTDNFKAMNDAGYLYQPDLLEGAKDWINFPFTFYDAFNAGAGKMFWDQINKNLFSRGIDAWWMDATEPDLISSPPTLDRMKEHMSPTALGTASRTLNAYPLYNSRAIYDGQRSAAPDQRVFILTRSGFAGQQRYATATWSGDITSTWTALAKQIPAGLGFCLSGVPYWTTDIGGYTMDSRFGNRNQTAEAAAEWRELNVRWFQYGTFCPLLRVHGEIQPREMWHLGDESSAAYQAELKFDHLRYAMLPYIYSTAASVSRHGSTMMRALVMDFPQDAAARDITDQYMFGPSFLVSPVTSYRATHRAVYLPKSAGWFDFWTGEFAESGRQIDAKAPLESLPVYVRAGSIVPFGPEVQWTDEKPADPIRLYIYGGADGEFTLYEDDGTTNGWEKGAFSEIPIRWNESRHTLTIGQRTGTYPGMLSERTFEVVLVTKNKPVAYSPDSTPAKSVRYRGASLDLQLP